MDFISGLFQSQPFDVDRVGLWGLMLMLVGLIVNLMARRLSRRAAEDKRDRAYLIIRFSGLMVVIVGALMAMKII